MKKTITLLVIFTLLVSCLSACAGSKESQGNSSFTDSADRTVELPAEITRIAPSGAVAQMILLTIAPEYMVGLSGTPKEEQVNYFPQEVQNLPAFGQFYGSKANLNLEALLAAEPQLIIDLGDPKGSIKEDMDGIQQQTGIATVFIDASLTKLPAAYRTLGVLLNKQEQAEKLASYIENTLKTAEENAAKIPETDRLTVLFGTGEDGLACNAQGSSQADVIELIGAVNAVTTDEITSKSGGTIVDLEQVYSYDPDVMIFSPAGFYETLPNDQWAELTAVKNGSYYEIPNRPYNWMAEPPSVNRVLGIWWLGNLLYPELYNYDMIEKAQEYYSLFWHYELSEQEAQELLSRSTGK